ncbi:hypothetical protein V5O39_27225 [Pseudomonas parakoreensis]
MDSDLTGVTRLRVITNYFTRMRFCTADGKLDLKSKEGLDTAPPGYKPWFQHKERKTRGLRIIFGHWAALEGDVREPGVSALDTGCVWGGSLTLMNVDSGERVSCKCDEHGGLARPSRHLSRNVASQRPALDCAFCRATGTRHERIQTNPPGTGPGPA